MELSEVDLLPRAAVARRCGVTVRTLERWASRNIGPKPVRLGPRLIRYRCSEVEQWLQQLSAEQDGGQAA